MSSQNINFCSIATNVSHLITLLLHNEICNNPKEIFKGGIKIIEELYTEYIYENENKTTQMITKLTFDTFETYDTVKPVLLSFQKCSLDESISSMLIKFRNFLLRWAENLEIPDNETNNAILISYFFRNLSEKMNDKICWK